MKHIKRLRGYYLALLVLIILLIVTLSWFYLYFRNHFGPEIAMIFLILSLAGEIFLITRGVIRTHQIHSILRQQVDASPRPVTAETIENPMLFKIFDMDLNPIAIAVPEKTEMSKVRMEIQKLLDTPKKRRGKQPRFPIEEIREAVLEWEQRDQSFSVETLEEFLGRKFGYGPDGILLMSVSTFYDWRRRTFDELDPYRFSSNEADHTACLVPSEPASHTHESSS